MVDIYNIVTYEQIIHSAQTRKWPYVTVYESVEELFKKLESSDLGRISDNMKEFNKIREADLLDNWCKILQTKDKQTNTPKTYEEALKYFETETFQV